MKIILTKDVANLGFLGDEVDVKNGYARNYLIPQGYAIAITPSNQKRIEHRRTYLSQKRLESIEACKLVAEKIEATKFQFEVKAGEQGKLFGSVTSKQIVELFSEKGIHIDRKMLHMAAPLKKIGSHSLPIRLHTEVETTATIHLVSE